VRWTCKEHDDPHLQFSTEAKTSTIGEQQIDYDADTNDTQPTAGLLIRQDPEGPDLLVDAESGETILTCKSFDVAPEEAENARLIAAAGTAASEMPDEYDPVEAMRQLPKMLELLEMAMNGLQHFRGLCPEGRSAKDHEVIDRIKNVLDAAHKDTQTDA
jgi:hypothetical protein